MYTIFRGLRIAQRTWLTRVDGVRVNRGVGSREAPVGVGVVC